MFRTIASQASIWIDTLGVAIITLGLVAALLRFAWPTGVSFVDRYQQVRRDAGRAILLGLEFLVASDLIRTVAVERTLENLANLAVIVAIRTFLSMTMHLELEGRWPWQGDSNQ